MVTIADAVTSLVTAVANAFNARTRPGASAFEIAVANGYAGTQAQWLLLQQGAMTSAQRLALAGADLWRGREVIESDTGITWKYLIANTASGKAAGWQKWETDWIAYDPVQNGITGTLNGSPGWTQVAQYRYQGGQIRAQGGLYLGTGGTTLNGNLSFLLPVAPTAVSVGRILLTVVAKNASDGYAEYDLGGSASGTRFTFSAAMSANQRNYPVQTTVPFNEAWGQSDEVTWELLYDPA